MSQVLVGVDGSAPSLGAATIAARRAAELGWPLHIVHVLDDEWGAAGMDFAHDMEHEAAALLSRIALTLEVPGGVSTRLVHGSAIQELSKLVTPGDLLVVGSHKTGYTRGLALGSLSVRLAPVVPCSLLVIPDAPSVMRRGVVLGIAAEPSLPAREVAVQEATTHGESLTLVAAVPAEHRA